MLWDHFFQMETKWPDYIYLSRQEACRAWPVSMAPGAYWMILFLIAISVEKKLLTLSFPICVKYKVGGILDTKEPEDCRIALEKPRGWKFRDMKQRLEGRVREPREREICQPS